MKEMGRIALGTHLGDFSEEDSQKYIQAIIHSIRNGIYTIDGAINYRGMCSEKDEGIAINTLMQEDNLKRDDLFITSKAGLLFGDVRASINPQRYLNEILISNGITKEDFAEYEGLYQTLNPLFYETALNKSLQNLGLDYLDVHYIHIPEISRMVMSEKQFYDKMELLFKWYEQKISEGKIRHYGIALEFMVEEPDNENWHFEIEEIKLRSDRAANGNSHLKYILFEYNMECHSANTVANQSINLQKMSLINACHELGLQTVASMPFLQGDGFNRYSLREMLDYVTAAMDHVIVGSKNINHIDEIIKISA